MFVYIWISNQLLVYIWTPKISCFFTFEFQINRLFTFSLLYNQLFRACFSPDFALSEYMGYQAVFLKSAVCLHLVDSTTVDSTSANVLNFELQVDEYSQVQVGHLNESESPNLKVLQVPAGLKKPRRSIILRPQRHLYQHLRHLCK